MFAQHTCRMMRILIIFAGLLPFSCNLIEFRPDDQLLAEVYGNRLYLYDIQGVVPAGVASGDSAAMVKRYVDRWVDQQVYARHAKEYANMETRNIEQRVEDYRNALLVHAFEQDLVKNELDTIVTDNEINAYYDEHQERLKLRNTIVAVNFIKLPLNAGGVNQVRSLCRSDADNDLHRLRDVSLEHAASYHIDPGQWLVFNDLIKEMPLDIDDPVSFLHNNRFVEITDDYYRYFLYIHDFRVRGAQSPKAFEKENIRQRILSRRKKDFLQNRRRDMLNSAIEGNHVEVFY